MTEQGAIKVFNTVLLLGKCELPADEANEAIKLSIKALEEIQKYRAIGTVEECREAVEKQKEMKAYCDENDCVGCPYHNVQLKENRCMNDFIADEIMKGG